MSALVIDDPLVIHLTLTRVGQSTTVIAAFIAEEISVPDITEQVAVLLASEEMSAIQVVDMVVEPNVVDTVSTPEISEEEEVC